MTSGDDVTKDDAMEQQELLRLIAINAYAAWSNVLMATAAPRGREIFNRINAPQPGDLVLETSTIWNAARSSREQFPNLGTLLRIADEPVMTQEQLDQMHAEGDCYTKPDETLDQIPKERVWYIAPLDGSVPEYRWTNASFIQVFNSMEQFR